ncbi:MAG: LysM peptidoglycan-binding domain-containing protein [Thermodesulfobacteriota bacterium]
MKKRAARYRCGQVFLALLTGFFLISGCGPLGPYGGMREDAPTGKGGEPQKVQGVSPAEPTPADRPEIQADQRPPGTRDETSSQASSQEILDSALEFLQASTEYWEQGDLENAVDALDKAYGLILEVDADDDPDLIQQKEDLRSTIAKQIVQVYASRFTVAEGLHKAIPLEMNEHVKREIESFTGRERDFFLAAYRRSGRYRSAILKALAEAGIPKELSWLPLIESGFKVRAFSRARALGLWQFIASTGYKYGLKRDNWIDERMDPEKSTDAAIAYLKDLHQMFGDWTTALAGYNCGEFAVLNRIKTQRINYLDNFWDLYEKLPRETAAYVPRLLAVLHIVNNPSAYGMVLPPVDEEPKVEEVTVSKKVRIRTIANRLDVDCDHLQELNAELRQDMTPDSPYPLKVPLGKGRVLLAKLSDIPESDLPAWRPYTQAPPYTVHTVKKGETLASIARKYRTHVKAIKEMNGFGKSEAVQVGWTLKIPTKKGIVPVVATKVSQAETKPKIRTIEYVVKPGDSLWKIAGRYSTTPQDLRKLNKLAHPNLNEGQVLVIPAGPVAAPKAAKTKSYKVKSGDTPSIIAKKHNMELAEFLKLNNFSPKSKIFPGQAVQVTER